MLVIASANPMLWCAGADLKAFATLDAAAGADLLDDAHSLLRRMEESSTITIAAVNAVAYGGGCELAMGCDVRIAAQSASFGQPEINLGIIPGFGGTQRLPRLVGTARALELNLTGDPISAAEAFEIGLVTRVVPDHELLDVALAWARKLGGQAPLAVEAIKRTTAGDADLDEGIEAEKAAFAKVFVSADAREGISAFLGKRKAAWKGGVAALAELVRSAGSVVALTGAGISVPSGIPDFRSPGTGIWENVDPLEVAHIDAWRRDPERFWSFYGARFQTLGDKRPNGAHAALVELEGRGLLDAVITQNVDMLHRKAGTRELVEVHGSIASSSCLECGARYELEEVLARLEGGDRRARVRLRPAAEAGRRPVRRVPAAGCDGARVRARGGSRAAAVRRLVAGGPPGRRPAAADARGRRSGRDRHAGHDAVRRPRRGQARRRRRGRAARARPPRCSARHRALAKRPARVQRGLSAITAGGTA